jgi:phenylpropionate dioxygenase-like ring-hydroxylating dioxygenase large terminal subunit
MDLSSLVTPQRVHRRVYTDESLFELEMERLFKRTWLYVAHESQLKNAGDFVRTRMGPSEVLVLRHEDGEIYVVKNSCAHRGARLCTAAQGNRQRIACSYHGWTYRNDGSLISVPHRESYAPSFDLDDREHWLRRAPRVSSYRGFIFASWAADGPTLVDYLHPMTEAIDNLVDRSPVGEIEVAGGGFSLHYAGNWKFHMENANDTIHPGFVHGSSVASAGDASDPVSPLDDGQTRTMLISNGFTEREWEQIELHGFEGGHSYMGGFYKSGILAVDTDDPVSAAYREAMVAGHGEARTEEILAMDRFQNLIYPTIALNAQFHQIRVVHPLSVDRTLVQGACFRLKGAPDAMFRRAVRFLNNLSSPASMIFGDDVEIFSRCQSGLAANGTEWVNSERGLEFDAPQSGGGYASPVASELPVREQFKAWLHYMRDETV